MNEKIAILLIVERGKADKIVESANKNGAKGATILYGRGTGKNDNKKLFNIKVESSKEIILMIVDKDDYSKMYKILLKSGEIEKPGKGIIFSIPVFDFMGLEFRND
ncbi:P-II family nitrogen regulator [Oceanotoga teriensis]|jgi:nitrogen regulatory protein PII|uniref:Nitrogen regulatory protein P-II family n=1 Tax=Oceanotoga teriensis TaxID=515440 RepID=A0AA45C5S8_9BACT|nr:P-II family nitrogen regulator [Oceanotoga teriensis]MDO7977397.1 hypothetical protein [Oceanotoga teriensis]PWJ89652.1 nitrogen regulatory protein P-II family [Oceanotoga teriensis]